MRNETPSDAFIRVRQARMGFGVNASDIFLLSLEAELYEWIDTIRKMLNQRKHHEIETIERERAGEV